MKVLLLEGGATTLAMLRCFADVDVQSTVVGFSRSSICQYSALGDYRYCQIPFENSVEFLAWLEGVRESMDADTVVLIPTSDRSALITAEHSVRLANSFAVFENNHKELLQLVRKRTLTETAADNGIGVPRWICNPDAGSARTWASNITPPYLVKPYYVAAPSAPFTDKNLVFQNSQDLVEFVAKNERRDMVVQEMMKGGDGNIYDCYGVCDRKGEVIVAATHRRIRQSPANCGVTSFGQIPAADAPFNQEELIRKTKYLFKVFKYHGIFGVEWLWDEESEELYLIDVNARPFSTIGHLHDCGLNLPHIAACELVHGQEFVVPEHTLVHRYWIDVPKDIQSVMEHRRGGRYLLRDWFRDIFKASSYAYWRLGDWKPAVIMAYRIARSLIAGAHRRIASMMPVSTRK